MNTPARIIVPVSAPGFSPARIFAQRSPGVVTVFTYFAGTGAQGSGFVVSPDGTILTNAHVITNAGEGSGPVKKAGSVYVEFSDHDRVPAPIVGWDVFDDVGVLKVEPGRHRLDPVPLGSSASLVVGEPVRRSAARSGTRTRSRSGSSPGRPLDRRPDRAALPADRRDPDRRADRPRQLRRPAARRPRPRDRDQRPDPQRCRRARRHRLRRSDRRCAALAPPAPHDRACRVRLCRDPGRRI